MLRLIAVPFIALGLALPAQAGAATRAERVKSSYQYMRQTLLNNDGRACKRFTSDYYFDTADFYDPDEVTASCGDLVAARGSTIAMWQFPPRLGAVHFKGNTACADQILNDAGSFFFLFENGAWKAHSPRSLRFYSKRCLRPTA